MTKKRINYNGGGTIDANELKERVKALGYTQRQFLQYIGKDVTHGNRYFTGKIEIPLYLVKIVESLELKNNIKKLID